jgi:hypothetical protein
LQNNLRKPITEFIMYDAIVWGFYRLNPELFKEDMDEDQLEKAIIKTTTILESSMRLDLYPDMVQKLTREYNAIMRYIEEARTANKSNVSPDAPT